MTAGDRFERAELTAMLRAYADDSPRDEAAVELLVAQGGWLGRADFLRDFVTVETDPETVGEAPLAVIDWPAAVAALDAGRLRASSSEAKILRITASLAAGVPLCLGEAVTGLGRAHIRWVAEAVLRAGGHPHTAALPGPETGQLDATAQAVREAVQEMAEASLDAARTLVQELAARAGALTGQIEAARESLTQSGDEHAQRAGFRLDTAIGNVHEARRGLAATVEDLGRLAGRGPGACQIPWGICPEHGNTLVGTAGRSTCQTCGRSWDYDRAGMPCEEPARWLLTDVEGATRRVCDGHGRDALARLVGARLTRLGSQAGEGDPQ